MYSDNKNNDDWVVRAIFLSLLLFISFSFIQKDSTLSSNSLHSSIVLVNNDNVDKGTIQSNFSDWRNLFLTVYFFELNSYSNDLISKYACLMDCKKFELQRLLCKDMFLAFKSSINWSYLFAPFLLFQDDDIVIS
jgi:hypothetical protein